MLISNITKWRCRGLTVVEEVISSELFDERVYSRPFVWRYSFTIGQDSRNRGWIVLSQQITVLVEGATPLIQSLVMSKKEEIPKVTYHNCPAIIHVSSSFPWVITDLSSPSQSTYSRTGSAGQVRLSQPSSKNFVQR